jgi:uncharacterized Zn-binding protein involved in type VI secretion
MSVQPVCRVGDKGSHGGVIIGPCSPTRIADGIPVARVTDMYDCPIPGHGINPIVQGSVCVTADGLAIAIMNLGGSTRCGDHFVTGSPSYSSE